MTTMSKAYDAAAYTGRQVVNMSSVTGAAGVSRFTVFTDSLLFSFQATVQTAGTSVGAGAGLVATVISGTSTTTLGTLTLGSSTANTTVNLVATSAAGGFPLIAGDRVILTQGTDATVVAVVCAELAIKPGATLTK